MFCNTQTSIFVKKRLQINPNNTFNPVGVSYFDIDCMSSKVYDDKDIVTIRYKFTGLVEEKIQCTYFQYKNLKELPDMEICEIMKNESE